MVIKLRLLSPYKHIVWIATAGKGHIYLAMSPDILREQNSTLDCGLTLGSIDGESICNLHWELKPTEFKREFHPTILQRYSGQYQHLVLVVLFCI